MDETRWAKVKGQIEAEVERFRKKALLAKDIDEMEEAAVVMGQAIQEAALAGAVEQRESQGRPRCPECGGAMQSKGKAARRVKTSLGVVRFDRQRWVCPECGGSLFPPGSANRA